MGRAPCCEKDSVKRGPWTPEEDAKLLACVAQHGTGNWRTLPRKAGLQRCGKSCRLRWINYLRPDLKHTRFTEQEEQLIVKLHAALGSRWSLIAAQLPGRTDNDVKNYWNTRLKKKLCEIGIDPITHKPISQLLADLAGNIALPKGGQIAEAALGCFKDGMLNVLMRTRPDWQNQQDCDTAILSNDNLTNGGLSWEVGGCSNMTFGAKPVGLAEMDPALLKMRQGMALHKMPMNINLGSMNMNLPPQTAASKHIMYANQQINDSRPILDVNYMNTSATKPSISYGRDALTFNPSMHWTHEPLASLDPAEITSSISHFPPAEEVATRNHEPVNKNQQNGALQFAWSPSGSAGSTCSSASVADAATFDRVMNSDVLLWDFSDV